MALINDKGARRVSLRMVRDVDADSVIDSFNDGLKNNLTEAQLTALKPQIDALTATLKSIGEAKKGDAINFDYTPDGGERSVLPEPIGRGGRVRCRQPGRRRGSQR